MDVREQVKVLLARPEAQQVIAKAKSEETKRFAIDELYEMLPRPVRWVLTKELFENTIRQHVFREASASVVKTDESPE